MKIETIPQRLFVSGLPAGGREFFCYLRILQDEPAPARVDEIAWQLIPDAARGAVASVSLAISEKQRETGRIPIAAALPPEWNGGRLEVEARLPHGSARDSWPVARYNQSGSYQLPLAGMLLVAGGHRIGEAHRSAAQFSSQHFAWDLLGLGADGWRILRTTPSNPLRADDFAGFGRDVLAPAAGRVVEAVDGFPDLPLAGDLPRVQDYSADPRGAFGNYVILEHEPGVWSLSAHLRRDSLEAGVGETVAAGTAIGQLGNSGFSSGPHLHFQFMDGPDPLSAGPLPIELEVEGERYAPQAGEILSGWHSA